MPPESRVKGRARAEPRRAQQPPVPPYCRACGSLTKASESCDVCGAPLGTPQGSLHEILGTVFPIRAGFRRINAIAVDGTPSEPILLTKGTRTKTFSSDKLANSLDARWMDPAIRSPAWRLWLAREEPATEGIAASWSSRFLEERALSLAAKSIDEARLFALDALDAGDLNVLGSLPLTETERRWLGALGLARSARWEDALRELLELPHDGYPEKILIIGKSLRSFEDNGELAADIGKHLAPFASKWPLAEMVRGILGLSSVRKVSVYKKALRSLADLLDRSVQNQSAPDRAELGAAARFLLQEDGSWQASYGALSPSSAVWHAVLSGTPVDIHLDPELIRRLPEPVVDELIDGRLDPHSDDGPWDLSGSSEYVRARLQPDLLTDEEVEALGFTGELARRAFLARDEELLESMRDKQDGRHYFYLNKLRMGIVDFAKELAKSISDEHRGVFDELVTCLRRPDIKRLSDQLLSDRSTWPVVADALGIVGAQKAKAPRGEVGAFLQWKALQESKQKLHEWNWEGALESARDCLAVAKEEAVRDEALNLLACAHWQLGNGEGAIQALETALEDEYNEALQTNIGVVAAELRPTVAGEHLGRLAQNAPTLELRVSAARRAIALWHSDPEPWAEESDEELTLPQTLKVAARKLVVEPIERTEFGELLHLLAVWDAEWVADASELSRSPHAETLEGRLYTARARDFSKYVSVLAEGMREQPPEWLVNECDNLVDSALSVLVADEPTGGAAFFGLQIVEANVPLENERLIPLTAFSVAALAANIDPSEGEPKDKFWDMLEGCTEGVGELTGPARERADLALDYAYDRLARTTFASRHHQYGQAIDAYNEVRYRLRGTMPWNVNRDAVRRMASPMLELANDTIQLFDEVRPHLKDEELIEALQEFRQELTRFQATVRSLPGVS